DSPLFSFNDPATPETYTLSLHDALPILRRIDELHLEHPFAGSRMLRDMLRTEGHAIGRKHVATLMRTMGVEALYRRPNTSKRHAAHRIYPGVSGFLCVRPL